MDISCILYLHFMFSTYHLKMNNCVLKCIYISSKICCAYLEGYQIKFNNVRIMVHE